MKAAKLALVTFFAALFITGCMSKVPTDPKDIAGGGAAAAKKATLMLEDCDDSDNLNLWGGYWYAYDDAADGGDSRVFPPKGATFYMTYNGNRLEGSLYGAKIWGYTTNTFLNSFFGAGTTISPDESPVNLYALYKGIRFWARSADDATDISVPAPSAPAIGPRPNERLGNSGPLYQFRCSFKVPWINPKTNSYPTFVFGADSHWRQYEFDFASVEAAWTGGWDAGWTPANTMNQVLAVQYQTHNDDPRGYRELWVDMIEFYN